jgi:hypothetical protein
MLWFDDDGARSVEDKVRRAASHYASKYGSAPTLCYVHPSMLDNGGLKADGVEVRTANTVLPHHFWLGQGEDNKKRKHTAA